MFSRSVSNLALMSLAFAFASSKPMPEGDSSTSGNTYLPPRYHGSLAGATFLSTYENGGVKTPPTQYEEVFIQAIDGNLVFTQNPPTRICPCANPDTTFGAKNFTGVYIGGTTDEPTLQLFTSGPEQQVYVDVDLVIRYTFPGAPIPFGANATSISFYDDEPSSEFPTSSAGSVKGYVTQLDGSRTYYNGYQFCPPPNSPPRTADGVGPLSISAAKAQGNVPDGQAIINKGCIGGSFFTSTNDSIVAPYDIQFNTPSKPLVFAYAN